MIRNIFIFLNLIPVVGILLSYLSVHVSPENSWVLSFLGLAYPYLLFANVVFVLIWLFSKVKYAFISIIAIGIGYSNLHHYFQLSGKSTEEKGIVVSSYNVKNFQGIKNKKRTELSKEVYEYIQTVKPNILCFQEASLKSQSSFPKSGNPKSTKNEFFKYIHQSKKGGQITYSSFPIIDKKEIHFKESANMMIISDLKIDDDTIRLFNCHLESYRFSDADISSLDSISFEKQEESLKKVRYTGAKLKHAFIKRAEQADTLSQLIKLSPYKVILCGDFNDTPVSYTYHKVIGDLKDAFVESGSGVGNSYLGKLPSFRIDYILHSEDFDSYNFKVDKVQLSDHYPINCTLIMKKAQPTE
ncbi:endonuclease/exonuclease/phosphatase family protein [Sunxiuqinia sp. A32]|uniref:endonuclease/exonuclease/phosphatase family protein n=1 Tax=Sunxiuqinia sp. A32 TaxID=3461496 RepID=UPI004045B98A